jgi:hypothetical protein
MNLLDDNDHDMAWRRVATAAGYNGFVHTNVDNNSPSSGSSARTVGSRNWLDPFLDATK